MSCTEDFFIKILLENKIQNWEANLFWLNIEHLSQIETKEQRQQMYNGLRVLTSNDYLRVEYSKYNRRIFLYSETLKLHQFRRNVLAENYNEVILNEKKLIIKELENFEHQKKFLDELYLKYPELAPQFFKLKNKLTSNQQYSDAKLRAIDGLICSNSDFI